MEIANQTPLKKNKKPLIIAGIAALLLGLGLGAYLWNSQVKELKSNLRSSSQMIEELEKQINSSSDQASDTSADSTKYLIIKEWGIKIPLDENTADLNYVIKNGYVYFGTKSITEKYGEDCSAENISLGGISRGAKEDKYNDTPFTEWPGVVKAGSYYYIFSGPQATCGEPGESSDSQQLTNVLQSIRTQSGKLVTV